jgi:MFS family permease
MKETLNDKQQIVSKEEEFIDKGKKNLLLIAGVRNLIANEINAVAFNALMSLMTVNIYRISYLRHFQEEKTLDLQYSYFNSVVFSITMAVTNLFATTFEKKLGLKRVIILGVIIRSVSYVILYFSKFFFLDLFSYFVLALSLSPVMLMGRNFMHFFFEIRGKLTGALAIVGALLSSGFKIIAEKIVVNPESDEADVDEKFYTYDVSKRVNNYIIVVFIINIVNSILVLLIIVPYNKEKHGKGLSFGGRSSSRDSSINDSEEKNKETTEEENDKKKETIEEENKNNEENQLDNNERKPPKRSFKKTFIKKAIKSKRIIILSLVSLFTSPLISFFGHQWRNIAIRNNIPTSYQQNIIAIVPFVNCFSQLVFGWISDSISFRYIYSILSFILSFIGIIFCFSFKSPILFSICIIVFNLASNGRMSIGGPHYMKVFGLKNYIEISTIIRLPTTIVNTISPFLMFFFDNQLKDNRSENLFIRYFILYLILAILNTVSAVLSLFETEDLFVLE